MKYLLFLLISLCVVVSVEAQYSQYIVRLKDKNGSEFSVTRPQEFLSQRAIDRRQKYNIPVVENDLPVVKAYLDSIRNAGSVVIKNTSKWLNQVLIQTSDINALNKINSFPFVLGTSPSKRTAPIQPDKRKKLTQDFKEIASPAEVKGATGLDYGYSEGQIKINHGDFLHDKGFNGKGMLIAVIDDGFYHYKTLPAFDSVRLQNRILDTYDFVANKVDMNEEDAHGMYCFSLMSANMPGMMIGTAPGASYLLYRSEDVSSESLSEEQNWVAAAERSDSAGADVVTTSLGYNQFDKPIFNHTYADMDGKTTIIARGANFAAAKGMLILAAAGNEGNKPWHYIITPADATGVLTVGAVDINRQPGYFTSYGPSVDGRVKPDVASMGVATVVQAAAGGFATANGTSLATPNLAGLVTCLWQAFPEFSSSEIMDFVRKSSPTYHTPDARTGYGIPDFQVAYEMLMTERINRNASVILANRNIAIYPNPFSVVTHVLIKPQATTNTVVRLVDMSGKVCFKTSIALTSGQIYILDIQKNALSRGLYILQLSDGVNNYREKVVIQ